MEYGKRLNPVRSLRTPKGIKGIRQKVIVTHNPSEIDQAQELLVRFPNLGSDDVIISGTANLSFNPNTHLPQRIINKNIWKSRWKSMGYPIMGHGTHDHSLFIKIFSR